jgi:ketosteroid isomerase-like protein
MSHQPLSTAKREPEGFSQAWLDAWNSHDLDRILSLYEDDFKFSSPILKKLMPQTGGYLEGKSAAKAYWSHAFAPGIFLRFEKIAVLNGVDSVVIHYKGLGGKLCAEFFQFGASGKITESHAHEYPSSAA